MMTVSAISWVIQMFQARALADRLIRDGLSGRYWDARHREGECERNARRAWKQAGRQWAGIELLIQRAKNTATDWEGTIPCN